MVPHSHIRGVNHMDKLTKLFMFFVTVLLVILAIILLDSKVKADTTNWAYLPNLQECKLDGVCIEEAKVYSRVVGEKRLSDFRVVKDDVRRAIDEAAHKVSLNFVPTNIPLTKNFFTKAFNEAMTNAIRGDNRVTFGIVYDNKYNTPEVNATGVFVGSIFVTFKDDRSEVSWRFDVVFEQNISPVVIEHTL